MTNAERIAYLRELREQIYSPSGDEFKEEAKLDRRDRMRDINKGRN